MKGKKKLMEKKRKGRGKVKTMKTMKGTLKKTKKRGKKHGRG